MDHHPEPLEQRIAPANLAFAFGLGNAQNQTVDDIAVDPAGNTYVTGRFQGTVDFDPGPNVQNRTALAGDTDGFVAKYDSMGALAWVNVVRDSDKDTNPMQIAVSPRGEAFIFSEFGNAGISDVSFSDRLGPPALAIDLIGTPANVYVAKIDPGGTFRWAERYGSASSAAAQSADLAVDGSGGIYLLGKSIAGAGAGSLSFGAFTVNVDAGEQNLFVVKLQDGAGPSVVWVNETTSPGVASNSPERDLTIAANSAGNVAIRGVTDVPLTFATQVPTVTTQNIFVASLDGAGAWAWVRGWTGGTDNIATVALNAAGDVYVLGDFTGTTDADPGAATVNLTSAGLEDFFLTKLDPAGAFVFARQFGNADSNSAGQLAGVDAAGKVYFTGDIGDTRFDADPGAGIVNVTGKAGAVITLDTDGAFVAVDVNRAINAQDSLAVDLDGGLHRGGEFTGQINVGLDAAPKTLASKGATDFFVARYFPGDLVAQDLQQPVLAQSFSLGGVGDQFGGPVMTDAAGNLYVAGLFSGTVDFDRSATVAKNLTSSDKDGNAFIAKYDALGALQWARQVQMSLTFDTNADDVAVNLALDLAGNVYIATEFDVSATLGGFTERNSEPAPLGSSRDIFIAKIGSDGTPIWANSIGSSGQNDFVDTFAVRASTGDVVLGGEFSGTVNFDPAAGAAGTRTAVNGGGGQNDGYIVELDTAGAFKWVRQLGGAASQVEVKSLGFLSGGDVVAAGGLEGTIDFNLGGLAVLITSSSGGKASFAARFTAGAGSVVWADGFGGSTKSSNRTTLAISATDEIFIAGQFTGARDFDPRAGAKILIESGGGAAGTSEGDVFLQKLDANGALLDAVSFGGPGGDGPEVVALDGGGSLYLIGKMGQVIDLDPGPGIARLIGTTDNNVFVSRFDAATLRFISGYKIPAFSPNGDPPGNKGPGIDASANGGFWVDASGNTFFSAGFVGSLDLDPAGPLPALTSKGARDIVLVKFKPLDVFDAAHPRTFHDANGDLVTLKLTGPGTATYALIGGVGDLADLASLSLTGTSLVTTVSISATPFGRGVGESVVQKILTTQTNQHLGTITLGPKITLGDGLADTVVDLRVSGALKGLKLRELAAGAILRLGEDLPYDEIDPKIPDTKNNFPSFAIGNVLGPGVQLVVLGKDAPLDGPNAGHGSAGDALHPGGGGLGHLTIGQWKFPGFIRTTQGIGNLTVLTGDFYCDLEIDRFRVGTTTEAGVGTMTIEDGSWGSTATEIEGGVTAFNAEAFLLNAQITAASIGTVATTTGSFDGTLILTDPDSTAVPVFTVTTDFTGTVDSAASIKRLNIKGDFTGTLKAPSIGAITAYAFLGAIDGLGVPTTQIKATAGSLGTLTTTAGVVKDYEIVTTDAFKGFKVRLTNLTQDTVGIDNVKITAASIGAITVSLAAKTTAAAGVDLIGIRNSHFVTTATGTTRATAGTIGNVSVTLTGGVGGGAATGLEAVTFQALVGALPTPMSTLNSMGTITVRITGQDGATLGLDTVSVAANSIGATRVTVNRGTALTATATAIDGVDFTATGAVGALTIGGNATAAQVSDLQIWAGGSVGAVTVKATLPAYGTLADSAILAGQSLALTGGTSIEQQVALAAAKLGAVNLSGSLLNTDLIAGSSIGAITIGGSVTDSLILAGAMLGGDFAVGGNETYQRAASIAAITIKGTLSATSIAAGINPGNTVFGDGDDTAAAVPNWLTQTSFIGAISLPTGTLGDASGTYTFSDSIQAGALNSLKLGLTPAIKILSGLPRFLDQTPLGEGTGDVIVRVIA